MTRTFEDIEAEAVSLIEALDASAHSQGDTGARWRETSIPFSVAEDASSLGHLLFEVWIQDAPNSTLSRAGEINEQAATIAARLRVLFTYRVRSSQQIRDRRSATGAAHDIVRALMQPWNYDTNGCVDLLLVNALRVDMTADGEWLLVSQDYIVEFDLDTSAPVVES